MAYTYLAGHAAAGCGLLSTSVSAVGQALVFLQLENNLVDRALFGRRLWHLLQRADAETVVSRNAAISPTRAMEGRTCRALYLEQEGKKAVVAVREGQSC